VAIDTADGFKLAATLYEPGGGGEGKPAVLAIHHEGGDRSVWKALGERAAQQRISLLALDLRGHGDSGGSSSALGAMQQDVQAGIDWLKTRPDVVASRLGIAGASLGAALAPLVAALDPAVRSIALLSPSSEYRGLRCEASMRKFAERAGAVMLVASTGDPYALRTAHHFEAMGTGPRDLRIVDGTNAHCTALLAIRPDLVTSLVDWFQRSLL